MVEVRLVVVVECVWAKGEGSCRVMKRCVVADALVVLVREEVVVEEVEVAMYTEFCACDGGGGVASCGNDGDSVGGGEDTSLLVIVSTFRVEVWTVGLLVEGVAFVLEEEAGVDAL